MEQQFPGQQLRPQPPKSEWNIAVILAIAVPVVLVGTCAASCLMCGIIGALNEPRGDGASSAGASSENLARTKERTQPPDQRPSPDTSGSNTADDSRKQEAVSNVTWREFNEAHSIMSDKTDIQKEALWNKYKGKRVRWRGRVLDVRKGLLGGLTLNVKMNEETLAFDLIVNLRKDQENTATTLSKDDVVTFTGTLKSLGGSILPTSLDDGAIERVK